MLSSSFSVNELTMLLGLAVVAGSGVSVGATQTGGSTAEDSVQAAAAATAVFPEVRGSNLEGREFALPSDFEGEVNLVFIAFKRGQQELVDTWLPLAKDLTVRYGGLRYYELPTIHKTNAAVRWFINNGMRRGIEDVHARESTITLYIDKDPFREALGLAHEDTIYVLLVDAQGRVLWKTEGKHTGEHASEIERIAAERLSPGME
jgi:hypothetical protein